MPFWLQEYVDSATPLIFVDRFNPILFGLVFGPMMLVDLGFFYENVSYKKYRHLAMAVVGVMFFMLFTFVQNQAIHKVLSSGKGKFFVHLLLSGNREIITNKSFVFLGETRNHYFFQNVKTHTNVIVPSSEVKEVRQRLLFWDSTNIVDLIEGNKSK